MYVLTKFCFYQLFFLVKVHYFIVPTIEPRSLANQLALEKGDLLNDWQLGESRNLICNDAGTEARGDATAQQRSRRVLGVPPGWGRPQRGCLHPLSKIFTLCDQQAKEDATIHSQFVPSN